MAVKERVGVVVSDKMEKTVVVAVENRALTRSIAKLWCERSAIRFTTRKTSAKRAIAFGFKKPVRSAAQSVGPSWTS